MSKQPSATIVFAGLLAVLLFTPNLLAQSEDWPRVVAEGHLTLNIPPSFEVDSSAFRFDTNEAGDVYYLLEGQSTIRAGSRADEEPQASESLRRANLIIDMDLREPGSFQRLGEKFGFSQEELDQLDQEMRVGFTQQAAQNNDLRDIQWDGTHIIQLKQAQAINLRLTGTARDSDDRYVINIYIIQDFDTTYYITISYLEPESDTWIPDFERIFSSIEFVPRG